MSILVKRAGALTSIQDQGRFGMQEMGFSPGGSCDTVSMKLANILVGNNSEEAVLECTVMGPSLFFEQDSFIAITGGEMNAKLNQVVVPRYETIFVPAGSTLDFGFVTTGCRTYIGISGGIPVDPVLNSRSTNMKCKIGGLKGEALKDGDRIPFKVLRQLKTPFIKIDPADEAVPYSRFSSENTKVHTIRVVKGPQEEAFTQKGIDTFQTSVYSVSTDSNRMGYRLEGEKIEFTSKADIISDGIALGAVQIAANGQPIIMMADRQTTGGYAKIGTVISTDVPVIAQLRPEEKIKFQFIEVKEAQELYRIEKKKTEKLEKQIQKMYKKFKVQ